MKSHFLIEDRFLGSLLYFIDKDGRGCLKLSFKNKVSGFVKGTDGPTTLPVLPALTDPINIDVSYKFQDSLLEVKTVLNGKVKPEFYRVPLPISRWLFSIKIRDWHLLDIRKKKLRFPLVLTAPTDSDSVAIVFSFLGSDGRPFKPTEYDCLMKTIELPEQSQRTFCIGIAPDARPSDMHDLTIVIPPLGGRIVQGQ